VVNNWQGLRSIQDYTGMFLLNALYQVPIPLLAGAAGNAVQARPEYRAEKEGGQKKKNPLA
jgi:hypothetical protein